MCIGLGVASVTLRITTYCALALFVMADAESVCALQATRLEQKDEDVCNLASDMNCSCLESAAKF